MVFCELKPHKEDPNRTRITVSGSQIYYPVDVGTPTGSLDLVKLIINSVLSRHNAHFFCFDLKTSTSKSRWKDLSMCAQNSHISHQNSLKNNLTQSVQNGWIYFEILRSCYGLPQSGRLHIFRSRDTKRQPQHLVSGAINGAPFNLS